MEKKLTAQNFDEIVAKADGAVLIDFWATWCGPCRMIAPIIEEIANEHPEITVCKVNVDEEAALAAKFQIQYIPTLVVMKNGQVTRRESGYRDKAGVLALLND